MTVQELDRENGSYERTHCMEGIQHLSHLDGKEKGLAATASLVTLGACVAELLRSMRPLVSEVVNLYHHTTSAPDERWSRHG